MIIGIGSDLTDIRRIADTLQRFGTRFTNRVFTDIEREKAERRSRRADTYAKRFAAKEACAKALGTGMSGGVFWRDMGVVNDAAGKPAMRLTGGARARLEELTPPGMVSRIHLSVSDDGPMAMAFVIIEAIRKDEAQ